MSVTKTKDTSRQMLAPCKRVVVKVGSSLLTGPDNGLQVTKIDAYATQIAKLAATGHQVTLVSSGAVAAGCLRLGWSERPIKCICCKPRLLSGRWDWSKAMKARCVNMAVVLQ